MGCDTDGPDRFEARACTRASCAENTLSVMAPFASAPGEHETLRRAALEAVRNSRPDAAELNRRYAELCVKAFAAPVPILWPRRTRGRALRTLVLVGPREAAVDATL